MWWKACLCMCGMGLYGERVSMYIYGSGVCVWNGAPVFFSRG